MNQQIAEDTVELARTSFPDNLLATWVGGSYARGTTKPTSDVDTVVILREPDHDAERTFAEQFRRQRPVGWWTSDRREPRV